MSADERSPGLILRTRPLTESSLIIHWLTPDLGRLATVAKGARRPKSPFAGKLDLFCEADFSFQRSRKSTLHLLKEVVLKNAHAPLRREIAWVNQASYFVVLVEQSTETETPLPEIFSLLQQTLAALPLHPPSPLPVLRFESILLQQLGFDPQAARAPLGKLPNALLEELLEGHGFEDGNAPAPPAAVLRELDNFLRLQVGSALERIPPQRQSALRFA